MATELAGFLAYGFATNLAFPFLTEQWHHEIVPELQWRDRTGFSPVSLLTLRGNDDGKAPIGVKIQLNKQNLSPHYIERPMERKASYFVDQRQTPPQLHDAPDGA